MPDSLKVLAIDPGGTTGFALWQKESATEAHTAWEKAGFYATCEQIRDCVQYKRVNVVVCERFNITPQTLKKTREGSMQAIELIGFARWACVHNPGCEFVLQAPADAARFITPERLKALGWWTVGSDHARSASKHLVLYLIRQKLIDPRLLLDISPEAS